MQVRTFTYTLRNGDYWCWDGPIQMDAHIQSMVENGWELLNSIADTGHVRVGKTLLVAGMTGGLSLLFGGSRTAKTITLTFKTDQPAPPDAPHNSNEPAPIWVMIFVFMVFVWVLSAALGRQ